MTRDPARRAEWLLMYRHGLDAGDIARTCHTLPHLVREYLCQQVQRDPSIFGKRLGRCGEPSLPVYRDEDAKRGWEGNRLSLARFIESHGRYPRRSADTSTTSGALEVFLYHWARAQRGESAAGRLTARQERQLEALPRWTVLGRDQLNARHWDRRLSACEAFIGKHGRIPAYRGGTTEHERGLGAWLSRQRARGRRGLLPTARTAALEQLIGQVGASKAPPRAAGPSK
ncbi:helicase associated domain-containing protein [Arthrobacter sp.]|uniref:helicase associated domain-containing protein n=1 Tax=Arthrobacter sp. TaxID=1667 RepID=UPI003A902800